MQNYVNEFEKFIEIRLKYLDQNNEKVQKIKVADLSKNKSILILDIETSMKKSLILRKTK